jgi:membrane protein implicated in regulation of membrane protease activity
MTGLAATLALVTALIFGGGLLTFAVAFLALSLLGAWYLKACYAHTNDAPLNQRKDEATGEET